ncbi:uncharacterized protein LOC123986486 [Micropterus dolomieu]|uniref:uncharacterized protein LOC123986486 n=1 Tax=Micropterus dolomieu TaxID=147949 RepID=UPI001E8CF1FB|nr:uncharacterized protein LOC123986486 [Micropterus dolomieu]
MAGPSHVPKPLRSTDESSKVCHYCQDPGHWKDHCPVLRSRSRRKSFAQSPAPALACSSVSKLKPICVDLGSGNGFEPFIADAVVSLVGKEERVPIKILRDTGAKHSFIVQSVLSFSSATETGDFILMQGMEMGLIPVPRHKMMLECDLVTGVVAVGVRPALPIDGVAMILGNDLAGGAVWADGPPSPVVVFKPLTSDDYGESGRSFPEVFPACAVTRAQSRVAAPGAPEPSVDVECGITFPTLPPSVSRDDWVKSQQTDQSLLSLLSGVLPESEIKNVAHGYFLQDGLLVRKWVPCHGDVVGEPVFQIVVPEDFRNLVLKIAHDESGHLGVWWFLMGKLMGGPMSGSLMTR